MVREQFASDLLQQAVLFRAMERGTQERGQPLDNDVKEWAGELTDKLLVSTKPPELQAGIEIAGLLKQDRHLDTPDGTGDDEQDAGATAQRRPDRAGRHRLAQARRHARQGADRRRRADRRARKRVQPAGPRQPDRRRRRNC